MSYGCSLRCRPGKGAAVVVRTALAVATALGARGAVAAVAGDPPSLMRVDVSDEVGTPEGLTTWRLYLVAEWPGEQEIHSFGESRGLLQPAGHRVQPYRIWTDDPLGFRNDAGPFAGLPRDDLPNAPLGAPWDSWVTIGFDTLTGAVATTPPFGGGDGTTSVVAGRAVAGLDGQVHSTGNWIAFDDTLLLGQFTVADGSTVHADLHTRMREYGTLTYWVRLTLAGDAPAVTDDRFRFGCTAADVDQDGAVGLTDLLAVLAAWELRPAVALDGGGRQLVVSEWGCDVDPLQERSLNATDSGAFDDLLVVDGAAGAAESQLVDGLRATPDGFVYECTAAVTVAASDCPDPGRALSAVSGITRRFLVHEPVHVSLETQGGVGRIELRGPDGPRDLTNADERTILEPGTYDLLAVQWVDTNDPDTRVTSTQSIAIHFADPAVLANVVAHDPGGPSDMVDEVDLLTILAAWGPCPD